MEEDEAIEVIKSGKIELDECFNILQSARSCVEETGFKDHYLSDQVIELAMSIVKSQPNYIEGILRNCLCVEGGYDSEMYTLTSAIIVEESPNPEFLELFVNIFQEQGPHRFEEEGLEDVQEGLMRSLLFSTDEEFQNAVCERIGIDWALYLEVQSDIDTIYGEGFGGPYESG